MNVYSFKIFPFPEAEFGCLVIYLIAELTVAILHLVKVSTLPPVGRKATLVPTEKRVCHGDLESGLNSGRVRHPHHGACNPSEDGSIQNKISGVSSDNAF